MIAAAAPLDLFTVATCTINDRDLGDAMVRRGYAVDFQRYSHGKYQDAEREAKEAQRGIWAGYFLRPDLWRREYQR